MSGQANPIDRPGTDEAVWANWPTLAHLPLLDTAGWARVVIVAAHPDDEVLGMGGTLALLTQAGVTLQLLAATDGEGSHPRSTVVTPADMAVRRIRETAAAFNSLGVGETEVVRMRLPDAGLAAYEAAITDELVGLLDGADACLAPWSADVHIDHEICGRAARAAGGATGVPVYEYPIWAWHWAVPDDPRVPWTDARRTSLPPEVLSRKRSALSCFESQIRPLGPSPDDAAILPPGTLAHFQRPFEVVFR